MAPRREATRAAWLVVRLMFRTWPAGAVGRVLVAAATYLGQGLVAGVALGRVIDDAGQGQVISVWAIVLVVAIVEPLLTMPLWDYIQAASMARLQQTADVEVALGALDPVGLEHLENPAYADKLQLVRNGSRGVSLLYDWMASFPGQVAGFLGGAIAIASVHPGLVVPLVLMFLAGPVHIATRKQAIRHLDENIPGQRLAKELRQIGVQPSSGAELRVLGLVPWLVARIRAIDDDVVRHLLVGERRVARGGIAGGVLEGALFAGGVVALAGLASRGAITAGQVGLGVVVLRSGLSQAGFLAQSTADVTRNLHAAQGYLWLLDYQPEVTRPDGASAVPAPTSLREGLELRNVSFRYPGSDALVLDNVNLVLPAGATVALVGDNGAGKTTLVKLLCRFYDPTSGTVLVDGHDLRQLDTDEWWATITPAFQDFARLEFLARETIGVGDVSAVDDTARVQAVAAKAGAGAVIARLEMGLETQLGRQFENGAELSSGQWQKLAVARASMREEPLLVLLDEPTAALDARAEHELFERYSAMKDAARARGALTVLVSHRFSTVAMADLIVVLEHGRVIEQGSHGHLLNVKGRYAEMYELQARAYIDVEAESP